MDTAQGELGRAVVIKGCISPGCRAVADRAILWETGGPVVRVVRSVEIRLVT